MHWVFNLHLVYVHACVIVYILDLIRCSWLFKLVLLIIRFTCSILCRGRPGRLFFHRWWRMEKASHTGTILCNSTKGNWEGFHWVRFLYRSLPLVQPSSLYILHVDTTLSCSQICRKAWFIGNIIYNSHSKVNLPFKKIRTVFFFFGLCRSSSSSSLDMYHMTLNLLITREYWNTKTTGTYHCICCDTPLYEWVLYFFWAFFCINFKTTLINLA